MRRHEKHIRLLIGGPAEFAGTEETLDGPPRSPSGEVELRTVKLDPEGVIAYDAAYRWYKSWRNPNAADSIVHYYRYIGARRGHVDQRCVLATVVR